MFPAGALLAQDDVIHASVTYHKDGTRSSVVNDPGKGTSEETVTDSAGKIKYKVTYLLDERSQPLGSITYDPKGNVMYRASYKRDGMDRVDEESISSADGQLMRRRVYTYGNGNKVTNIMEYDGNGNLVSDGRTKSSASPTVRRATAVRH